MCLKWLPHQKGRRMKHKLFLQKQGTAFRVSAQLRSHFLNTTFLGDWTRSGYLVKFEPTRCFLPRVWNGKRMSWEVAFGTYMWSRRNKRWESIQFQKKKTKRTELPWFLLLCAFIPIFHACSFPAPGFSQDNLKTFQRPPFYLRYSLNLRSWFPNSAN